MCMKRGFLLWVIMEIWRWGREGKEYNRYVGRYGKWRKMYGKWWKMKEERWKEEKIKIEKIWVRWKI